MVFQKLQIPMQGQPVFQVATDISRPHPKNCFPGSSKSSAERYAVSYRSFDSHDSEEVGLDMNWVVAPEFDLATGWNVVLGLKSISVITVSLYDCFEL